MKREEVLSLLEEENFAEEQNYTPGPGGIHVGPIGGMPAYNDVLIKKPAVNSKNK